MRILILNDGTQHEIYRCGAAEGYLWIGLSGETDLRNALDLFSDEKKTASMISTYDVEGTRRTVYEGYTQLIHLSLQEEGVLAALKHIPQTP